MRVFLWANLYEYLVIKILQFLGFLLISYYLETILKECEISGDFKKIFETWQHCACLRSTIPIYTILCGPNLYHSSRSQFVSFFAVLICNILCSPNLYYSLKSQFISFFVVPMKINLYNPNLYHSLQSQFILFFAVPIYIILCSPKLYHALQFQFILYFPVQK